MNAGESAQSPSREIPCPCCGQIIQEADWRARPARWEELNHLLDGARARGWTHDQVRYLAACLGICWAKAFKRGELALANVEARI